MKFTLTALAVLGLAVANPVIQKRALPSIPGLSIGNDGKGTLPRASAAVCKAGSGSCCPSGKTSCFDGWSCYQFQNHDVCIPPGWNYDGNGGVNPAHDANGPQLVGNWDCHGSIDCKHILDCDVSFGCD